ncbi:hypothetical protein ACFWZ2_05870 [Streptomyces sp. NPDC059002]|uniref:hypothetical protein n=1 Tax=Streptomyces sp. NPDC059002 TaxID=3346690 RepID=UPI00369B7A6E
MSAVTAPAGSRVWTRIHRTARDEGLAPALTVLRRTALDGRLPLGPRGHGMLAAAEVPQDVEELAATELPGGRVVMVRHARGPAAADPALALGLVWLRLGLSERLREDVVDHLQGRTVGDGNPLLQQQLVKAAVAEALLDHLEVRAVLDEAGTGMLSGPQLRDLQDQLTGADRAQVRLLGASGYLSSGPGQVAYVSELLAEAHRVEE